MAIDRNTATEVIGRDARRMQLSIDSEYTEPPRGVFCRRYTLSLGRVDLLLRLT
jgi:hypothetical protein